MALLHEHPRQGSYRVITVKAHVSLDTDDGEDRIWWGHCMADGWRSELYCYSHSKPSIFRSDRIIALKRNEPRRSDIGTEMKILLHLTHPLHLRCEY